MAVMAVVIAPHTSSGQEPVRRELQKAIQESDPLVETFEAWNHRTLVLQKKDFTEVFAADLGRVEQPDGWKESRMKLWQSLPDEIEPRIPLSTGAELFLLGLYEDNRAQFVEETGGERQILLSKLYYILGRSQQIARAQDSERILAHHTLAAVQQGWCGIWPFCLRTPAGRPVRNGINDP